MKVRLVLLPSTFKVVLLFSLLMVVKLKLFLLQKSELLSLLVNNFLYTVKSVQCLMTSIAMAPKLV